MTFKEFNFKPELQRAIDDAGFKEPSPVQEEAIPIILEGKDMVGQAHTGTGKTAAFGLPVLNMMALDGSVETVVIVPTRELATQVSDELYRFGKYLGVNTATVYGGSSYQRQIKHINNAGIIVATPGRFLDLLSNGQIDISPKFLILDEADEMLDMGFLDDIKEIFTYFDAPRQTLMFSATMPPAIRELSKTILYRPEFVTITKSNVTNDKIKQNYYVVREAERDDALIRLLDFKDPEKAIVFCRTKREVDRLSNFLASKGYMAKGLHGDMEQRQREEVIKAFKRDSLEILIATDVAARGLDVSNVTHVFNYHIPFDSESYVHRIGRTGRAGKEGVAVSIVTPHEFNSLKKIQKNVGSQLESKVIPTIEDVQMRQKDALKEKVASQEITDVARAFVEELQKEFVDEDIALKLASLMYKSNDIEGSDKIGMTTGEVEKLFNRFEHEEAQKRGAKKRNRGYNNRGRNKRRRDGDDRGGRNRNNNRRR